LLAAAVTPWLVAELGMGHEGFRELANSAADLGGWPEKLEAAAATQGRDRVVISVFEALDGDLDQLADAPDSMELLNPGNMPAIWLQQLLLLQDIHQTDDQGKIKDSVHSFIHNDEKPSNTLVRIWSCRGYYLVEAKLGDLGLMQPLHTLTPRGGGTQYYCIKAPPEDNAQLLQLRQQLKQWPKQPDLRRVPCVPLHDLFGWTRGTLESLRDLEKRMAATISSSSSSSSVPPWAQAAFKATASERSKLTNLLRGLVELFARWQVHQMWWAAAEFGAAEGYDLIKAPYKPDESDEDDAAADAAGEEEVQPRLYPVNEAKADVEADAELIHERLAKAASLLRKMLKAIPDRAIRSMFETLGACKVPEGEQLITWPKHWQCCHPCMQMRVGVVCLHDHPGSTSCAVLTCGVHNRHTN
jgi:hypothetical protein